jgi:hypothetical protein
VELAAHKVGGDLRAVRARGGPTTASAHPSKTGLGSSWSPWRTRPWPLQVCPAPP